MGRLGADPRQRSRTTIGAIAVVSAMIVLAMWGVTIAAIRGANEAAVEQLRSQGGNLAAAFADEVQHTLDNVAASMQAVAQRMRAEPGLYDIATWAREIPLLNGGTIQASIVGPDGRLAASTQDSSTNPVDLSDREHVRVHLAGRNVGIFIAKPVVGRISQRLTIQISRRVESGDGKLLGIIVFSLAPGQLTGLHRLLDLGPHDALALIGLDNVIRARFTRDHPDGLFGVGQTVTADPSRDVAQWEEISVRRASVIDDVERLFSLRRVNGYPLFVSVGLEPDGASDPDEAIFIACTATASVLIAGFAVYLVCEIRRRAAHEIELAGQRRELKAANNRLQVDIALRREAEQRLRSAQDMLRDAVDSVAEAFVIYDADDRLVLCNEPFRQLYPETNELIEAGARYEDMLRHGLSLGRYPEAAGREAAWLADRVRAHREPGEPVEVSFADGRWVLITERAMRNGGIAGLRVDITRLKSAETELRHTRDHLNRAQRIARMGSDVRDLSSDVMEWSDETYRIMGVERGQFVPTTDNFLELVVPDDRAKLIEAEQALWRGESSAPFDFRIQRPTGESRIIKREAELLYDDAGQPTAIAGTLHDVTAQREAEAHQQELERQLQHSQKLQAVGTLAGGIAHDINNTLTPIVILSELLLQDLSADRRTRRDLETILEAGRHSRDLVRAILAFSRKHEGGQATTDLSATIREAVQMLRATIPATIGLTAQIDDVPPLLGNAAQLQQVLVNLVNNGVQAIGDRMGVVSIRLWHEVRNVRPNDRRTGDSLCLRVSDSGTGMDRETMQRIFDPFFTTKTVGEGTGLGLSLVHSIVTGHGGRIAVDSEPGKGSEFTIYLPLHRVSTEPSIATAV